MSEKPRGILQKPIVQVVIYSLVLGAVMWFIITANSGSNAPNDPTPFFTPGEQLDPTLIDPTLIDPTPTVSPEPIVPPEEDVREHDEDDDDHHTVESDLSEEDGEAASDVVFEGVENYFAVGKKESLADRDKRLSAYFPEGSPYRDPTYSKAIILNPTDNPEGIVEQSGIIQWMNLKKATYKDGYVTVIGINTQVLLENQLMQGYIILEVTAEKLDDKWVITEILEVD